MPILWPAHIFHEPAELVAESGKDFVFVFYRFCVGVSTLDWTRRDEAVGAIKYHRGMVLARLLSAEDLAPARWWKAFLWH